MYACPYFVKVTYAMHGQSHEIITVKMYNERYAESMLYQSY